MAASGETTAVGADTLPSLTGVQVLSVKVARGPIDTAAAALATPDTALPHSPVLAGIDDIVLLTVHDLRSLVNRSKCLGVQGKAVAGCTPREIALYLDGRQIRGLEPESGAPVVGGADGTVRFHLQRSPNSDEAWADLLGAPPRTHASTRPTNVSVGLDGEYALNSRVTGHSFELIRFDPNRTVVAGLLFAAALTLFFVYVVRSNVLRDLGPEPDIGSRWREFAPRGAAEPRKPWSLARTQMAWWFFWVVGGFLFVTVITRAMDVLTGSALALIGISAATLLGAVAVDTSDTAAPDRAALIADRDAREAHLNAIAQQIKTLPAGTPIPPALLDDRTATRKMLRATYARLGLSQGLWNDLLADPQGQSFHRFQLIVWTAVLTWLFVVGVYRRLAMPDFSATLLGLVGICNGLYVGFKFPENKA